MNYKVEYKSIFEIVDLINETDRTEKFKKIEASEVEIHPIVFFDIFIIKDDNKTKDIFCSDKKTLDRIYYFSYQNMYLQNLTQSYRCFIIDYADIISVMEYKEFCYRYNYKSGGI